MPNKTTQPPDTGAAQETQKNNNVHSLSSQSRLQVVTPTKERSASLLRSPLSPSEQLKISIESALLKLARNIRNSQNFHEMLENANSLLSHDILEGSSKEIIDAIKVSDIYFFIEFEEGFSIPAMVKFQTENQVFQTLTFQKYNDTMKSSESTKKIVYEKISIQGKTALTLYVSYTPNSFDGKEISDFIQSKFQEIVIKECGMKFLELFQNEYLEYQSYFHPFFPVMSEKGLSAILQERKNIKQVSYITTFSLRELGGLKEVTGFIHSIKNSYSSKEVNISITGSQIHIISGKSFTFPTNYSFQSNETIIPVTDTRHIGEIIITL